jgi:hypothetical protein
MPESKEAREARRRLDNIGRALAALGNAKRYAAKAGLVLDTHEARMMLIEASTAIVKERS